MPIIDFPTGYANGQVFYDSTNNILWEWDGVAWRNTYVDYPSREIVVDGGTSAGLNANVTLTTTDNYAFKLINIERPFERVNIADYGSIADVAGTTVDRGTIVSGVTSQADYNELDYESYEGEGYTFIDPTNHTVTVYDGATRGGIKHLAATRHNLDYKRMDANQQGFVHLGLRANTDVSSAGYPLPLQVVNIIDNRLGSMKVHPVYGHTFFYSNYAGVYECNLFVEANNSTYQTYFATSDGLQPFTQSTPVGRFTNYTTTVRLSRPDYIYPVVTVDSTVGVTSKVTNAWMTLKFLGTTSNTYNVSQNCIVYTANTQTTSGWTSNGSVTISTVDNSYGPGFYVDTTVPYTYFYQSVPGIQSLLDTTITFDVRFNTYSSSNTVGFIFGASGDGQGNRIVIASTSETSNCSLNTGTTNWANYASETAYGNLTGIEVVPFTYGRVKLQIYYDSTATLYVNGNLVVSRQAVNLYGPWIGLTTSASSGARAYFNNIIIYKGIV